MVVVGWGECMRGVDALGGIVGWVMRGGGGDACEDGFAFTRECWKKKKEVCVHTT